MNENTKHWILDALLASHPNIDLPESLVMPLDSKKAWQQLHEVGHLPNSVIAHAIAKAYGVNTADIRNFKPAWKNNFSQDFCKELGLLPFDLNAEVPIIATYDPRLSPEQQKQIRFILGSDFSLCIASPDDIDTGHIGLFSSSRKTSGKGRIDLLYGDEGETASVKLAKAIFRSAIEKRASDIHIHPFVGGAAIRFRIDGILQRIATIPKETLDTLSRYLNAQAGLEPNPLVPQDGRLQLQYGVREVDVRLSLLPVFDGMRIVCRLLEQDKQFSLTHSGFSTADYQALKRLISYGTGIVLLTGPTGSGKTSTLYALLSELNTVDVNIMTLENPVEYVLPGISQVQINEAQGLSFAGTLRSILRQDPDVVLVGEIRDSETAGIAAQAALTGHMVLSTLHTNDAMATVPRLLDLGLDASVLADSLVGVVSQRLVRKLCTHCKQPISEHLDPLEEEFKRITSEAPSCRAVGCEECHFTGFSGRLPVTEILEVSPAMRTSMLAGTKNVSELVAVNSGFQTKMSASAANWIVSGETTVGEVYRELGLRIMNEMAECHGTQFRLMMTSSESNVMTEDRRPKILFITDQADLMAASTNLGNYSFLHVPNEIEAEKTLRDDFSIFAILIDTKTMDADPINWLKNLRTQLAWSGIPVLFISRQNNDILNKTLDAFNAHYLTLEQASMDGELLSRKIEALLTGR